MAFYVYILASQRNGTLYIGSTDNLVKRIWLHRNAIIQGFTKDYGGKAGRLVRDPRVAGMRPASRASDKEVESKVEARADREF